MERSDRLEYLWLEIRVGLLKRKTIHFLPIVLGIVLLFFGKGIGYIQAFFHYPLQDTFHFVDR